jgi:hypothetical protein
MNFINTLKNIYDKIKTSYNDYWDEYEKEMKSLSPEERMEIMATTQFNFMNQ